MSRDGFARADIDVGLFDDGKVKRLVRLVGRDRALEHIALYLAVVLESWASDDRVAVVDAAPIWLDDERLGELLVGLTESGLLDPEGRIPATSWEGWYGPARERRERRRESGAIGGVKSGEVRRSKGSAKQNGSDASRSLKQKRTQPPTLPKGKGGSRENRPPVPFRDAMTAAGLKEF